jgi:PAS domain S-box-containing protein
MNSHSARPSGRRNLPSSLCVMSASMEAEGAKMLPNARRAKTTLSDPQGRAREKVRRERDLIDSLPASVFELDLSGHLVYANPEWCDFSKCTQDVLEAIIHPDDVTAYQEALSAALERGTPFRFVARKKRHDGAWRKVRDEARPIICDGKATGYVGYSVDITDELEAREAAFRLGAQIQSAFRQRDVLMTEVHHRVKNNLQAILSMIGLHARRLSSQPARRDLDLVARRIRAMATIQQELHDDVDVSSIDLVLYVRRVVDALARLHGRDDVAISIEGAWADVSIGTAASVGAIIAELIANCFDHGLRHGKGRIAIAILRDGDVARLTLQDSGNGFEGGPARSDGIGLILAERIARHSRLTLSRGDGPGMPWTIAIPLQDCT